MHALLHRLQAMTTAGPNRTSFIGNTLASWRERCNKIASTDSAVRPAAVNNFSQGAKRNKRQEQPQRCGDLCRTDETQEDRRYVVRRMNHVGYRNIDCVVFANSARKRGRPICTTKGCPDDRANQGWRTQLLLPTLSIFLIH